jgi:hypothetical protein
MPMKTEELDPKKGISDLVRILKSLFRWHLVLQLPPFFTEHSEGIKTTGID